MKFGRESARAARTGKLEVFLAVVLLVLFGAAAALYFLGPEEVPDALSGRVEAGSPEPGALGEPGEPVPFGRLVAPDGEAASAAGATGARTPAPAGGRKFRETVTAEAAGRALLGRVILAETGAGLAGLRVTAELAELGPGRGQETVVTETADLGLFRVDLPGPATLVRISVQAGPETAALTRRFDLRVSGEEGDTGQLVLTVTRGATLRGRVVDATGAPFAGAEVFGWCRSLSEVDAALGAKPERYVAADGDGRFELRHMGRDFVLSASAGEAVCGQRLHGEVEPGGTLADLELVVDAGLTLSGRVIDPDGFGLEGVQLDLEADREQLPPYLTGIEGVKRAGQVATRLETTVDGAFAFHGLARQAVRVTARQPGFPTWSETIDPVDFEHEEWIVRFERGATLVGLVTDANARGVAGAEVVLSGEARGATTSEADGTFAFQGLAEDAAARLYVHAEGHAIQVVEGVRVLRTGSDSVEVRLEPGRALAGRVVHQDGRPAADALVAIEGDRVVSFAGRVVHPTPTWEWVLRRSQTRTDATGAFRFEDLYDGEFELRVTPAAPPAAPGRDEVSESQVLSLVARARSGTLDLVLRLDPDEMRGVVLLGRVFDVRSGAPVPEFQVTAMLPVGDQGGAAGAPRDFADPDGVFELAGLPPGPIGVNVSAPGFARWEQQRRDFERGEHELEVALVPARTLVLRIVDAAGRAVTDGKLTFLDAAGEKLWLPSGPHSTASSLPLAGSGETEVQGLPAEHLVLRIHAAPSWTPVEFDLDLTDPPRATLEFALPE